MPTTLQMSQTPLARRLWRETLWRREPAAGETACPTDAQTS